VPHTYCRQDEDEVPEQSYERFQAWYREVAARLWQASQVDVQRQGPVRAGVAELGEEAPRARADTQVALTTAGVRHEGLEGRHDEEVERVLGQIECVEVQLIARRDIRVDRGDDPKLRAGRQIQLGQAQNAEVDSYRGQGAVDRRGRQERARCAESRSRRSQTRRRP